MEWQITNANIYTDEGVLRAHGCLIQGERIARIIPPGESVADVPTLNLHGMHLFPGMINGHDSLLATYHAFRGELFPYHNWLAYDGELKGSALYRERMLFDVSLLYQLGAYKNLLQGVTGVVDHIPEFVRKPFEDRQPISLLKNYAIAHSVSSYSLNWGDGLETEIARSQRENIPFILHIAEGFDRESRDSLQKLHEMGGLTERTVLVHGLSLSDRDIDLIAEAGASLVVCPVSNLYLYDRLPPVNRLLSAGVRVVLGSDSAMAGSRGLLFDLQTFNSLLQDHGEKSLSSEELFRMVSSTSASVFGWEDRGRVQEGAHADFMILKNGGRHPLEDLLQAGPEDLFLVVSGGRPVYGDGSLQALFDSLEVEYDSFQSQRESRILVRGLQLILELVDELEGSRKRFDFIPDFLQI